MIKKDCVGVGSYVTLDTYGGHPSSNGKVLQSGEWFVACPGYPGADYGFPTVGPTVGVNIHITGRSVQMKWGLPMVRVKVEFVGDCEPSSFVGGWVKTTRQKAAKK